MNEETFGIIITANIKDFQKKMEQVKKIAQSVKSVEDRIKDNEIKITGVGFDEKAFNEAEKQYEEWRQKENAKPYFGKMETPKTSVKTEPDVKTNLFKKKMNELKNYGLNIANQIKQAWTNTNVDVDTNSAVVKIAQLKEQIRTLRAKMKGLDPNSRAFKNYANALNGAETELKDLVKAQKEASKSTDELNRKSTTTGGTIGKTFTKARNSIVRFGLSLLSVRTILSAVSKASSAYLSADTELADKLTSAWAGLGAFLAPIIEAIANKILKLVKYMNVFIKAVTGQDLLAKASAKATASLKKQTKATKELNKSLSTMDEITNIDKDENKNIGKDLGTNPFEAFDDVELDENIVDFLTRLGKKIREFWDTILVPFFKFVKDNWKWLLPLVITAVFVIALLIAKLSKTKALKSAGTDFTGFFDKLGDGLKNLMTLAGAALVLESIGHVIKEFSNLIKTFSESGLSLGEVAGLLGIALGELALAFVAIAGASKLIDLQGAIGAIAILGGLALVLNSVSGLLNTIGKTGMSAGDVFKTLAAVLGTVVVAMTALSVVALILGSNPLALIAVVALVGAISVILLVLEKTLPKILDAVGKFVERSGPILIGIINAISNGIAKIIYALGTSLPPIVDSIGRLFDRVFGGIASIVKGVINGIISGFNVLIRGLNKIKVKAPDWIPGVGGKELGFKIKEIPKLNVGTNYVPEDQLAYIHKGEAVVPKKFNSAEYFSNINNNEETNALLMDVNRNLIELIDKDTNLYINGKEFAQATYKDFKNEENRLGTSSVVNVR